MRLVSIIFVLYSFSTILSTQNAPVTQLEGFLEVYHPGDNTSILVGISAGQNIDTTLTRRSTIFGNNSGSSLTTGTGNSFFGYSSGTNTNTGFGNSFFGASSGTQNIEGTRNSFFGSGAGLANTRGSRNSFYGASSGAGNSTGEDNSFFGHLTGSNISIGSDNSFLGANSGENVSIGSANVIIGKSAGGSLTSGSRNIVIGYQAGPLNDQSDRLYIDNEQSNTALIYGEFDNDKVWINGSFETTEEVEVFGTDQNNQVDFSITSNDALIRLGYEKEGPHGFSFGDEEDRQGMKLLYRTNPNELRVEKGNDFSSDSGALLRLTELGDLIISGNYTPPSDRRLKKDIIPLKDAGATIDQLYGYTYYWKDDFRPSRKQIGLIAQEVREVLPELVHEDQEGMLTLDYISIIPILVEAVKNERKANRELDQKYQSLERRISKLERDH